MVRAKFKCVAKTPYHEGDESHKDGSRLKFEVVTSGSEENDNFFKWTPSGILDMGTVNEGAASQFEVGKEYYLDFTPVE